MSGHQAQVWHAGIFAKFASMMLVARASDAAPVWLVVDQDVNDPFVIDVPIHTDRGLSRSRWHIDPSGRSATLGAQHVPTGWRAAITPGDGPIVLDGAPAPARVPAVLADIRQAVATHRQAASAAEQVARATIDLALRHVGVIAPKIVLASALAHTDLFAEVVQRMAADPATMHAAYNRVVSSGGPRGLPALEAGEVPLWTLPPNRDQARARARVDDLARRPAAHFMPRALLLTGLCRLAACDLFIHGTGGAGPDAHSGYERVGESWLRDWLGPTEPEPLVLAPIAMSTATLRLRFPEARDELITLDPREIDQARWRAHAAQHHPGMLGDHARELLRVRAVTRLAELRNDRTTDGRQRRLAAYRELHALLAEARASGASRLVELALESDKLASIRGQAAVIADRTWSFPLLDPADLAGLVSELQAALLQSTT
jgi:hypothetical protein